MSSSDIGSNSRKRKADALGRLAESSSLSRLDPSTKFSATGRGSVTGWTTCPLCGRHSQKRYALGRGISSHLHAVHTPWNPGKVERKKRRRLFERKLAEARRNRAVESGVTQECAEEIQNVEKWDPTQKEMEEWDAKVLKIVVELDTQAADTSSMSTNQNRAGATQQPNVEFVQAGLDRSGKASQSYRDSLPLFLQVAADGDLSRLKSMVSEAADEESITKLLATRDRHLSNAEHWAAGGGHLSCLEYLLECRRKYAADTTAGGAQRKVRRRDGKTALHYAAKNGHLECVRYLIEKQGYAVEEVSGEGTTPFHMACFGCHPDVAVYLLQHGARVDAVNDWGCTAAHWLAMTRCGDPLVVRSMCSLLRDKGLSYVQAQKQGHSAMHKAAQVSPFSVQQRNKVTTVPVCLTFFNSSGSTNMSSNGCSSRLWMAGRA